MITGRNVNALEIVRANNPNAVGQQGEEAAYVFSGTSDAAAQVSAIAALVLAKRNWNSTQVRDLLVATARPFPSAASCASGRGLGLDSVVLEWSTRFERCRPRILRLLSRSLGVCQCRRGRRLHLRLKPPELLHTSGLVPALIFRTRT